VIISSKHGRAGLSPAVIGAIAGLCVLAGAAAFFLIGRR
jgi:hypothetical protein